MYRIGVYLLWIKYNDDHNLDQFFLNSIDRDAHETRASVRTLNSSRSTAQTSEEAPSKLTFIRVLIKKLVY